MNNKILKSLQSPWAIFIGGMIGILIGLYEKDLAHFISPIGTIYLTLLQLCVLPILISALVVCVFRLFKTENISKYLTKMLIIYLIGFSMFASVGIAVTTIVGPGNNVSIQTSQALGLLMLKKNSTGDIHEEVYINKQDTNTKKVETSFITNMFPSNIFDSLSHGNSLQVLIFAIILGIALGYVETHKSQVAVGFFDSTYDAFSNVVKGLIYLLPFGLCALLAENISTIGTEFLFAVMKLLIMIIGVAILMILIGTIIMFLKIPKISISKLIKVIKNPLILAFATSSSLSTIPTAINTLTQNIKFNEAQVNLIIPIGITVARFGTIMVFSIMTIYMVQLYEININFGVMFFVLAASILAGLSTAGSVGGVSASLIAIVLTPLGLPVETAITILLLANPIIDPFITTINVYGNMVATAMIAELPEE